MKPKKEILDLAGRMMALPTADKLTAAVMLIGEGKLEHAESFIKLALEDLQGRRLLNIQRAPLGAGRE